MQKFINAFNESGDAHPTVLTCGVIGAPIGEQVEHLKVTAQTFAG